MTKFYAKKQEEMLCYCMGITVDTVVDAIKAGYRSLNAIKAETAACTGDQCATKNPSGKCCAKDIKALIALYGGTPDTVSCDCCG